MNPNDEHDPLRHSWLRYLETAKMVTEENKKPDDPLRSTWLRYIGYASIIGEAIEPLMTEHSFLSVSNVLTNSYIDCDVFVQLYQTCQAECNLGNVFVSVLDTLIFHSLATVLFPMMVVNATTWVSYKTLQILKASDDALMYAPPIFGLAMLTHTSCLIDCFTHCLLNDTIRKLY